MDTHIRQPAVLLAEADAMVGADLGDALEQAGYRVFGPFATSVEAVSAIEHERPMVAVVDVLLRDGICTTLEGNLRRQGVPFLVHSGMLPADPRALAFKDVPWLGKPAQPRDVVALVQELASKAPEINPSPAVATSLATAAGTASNPLLRKLESFVALSSADRTILEKITANPRLVGPRIDLIREGEAPNGVLLIMDGMAYRYKARGNGARQIMAYLVPGDMSDIDGGLLGVMDHSITTLSPCRVVRIAPETLAELKQYHPQIARALCMSTLVAAATLREWLVNLGCRSAQERIAHLFCELLVRLRAVDQTDGDSFELPMTQAELGDTVSLSTVHVNRSLQELRGCKLISLKGRRLTILNLPQLKTLAEFAPNYLHLRASPAV